MTTTTSTRTVHGHPVREDGLLTPAVARRSLCGSAVSAADVDQIVLSNLHADLNGDINPSSDDGWYLHAFHLHAALSLPAFRGNPKNLGLLLAHPNLSSDSITTIVDAISTAVQTGTVPTGWGGVTPTARTPYSPRCLGGAIIAHPNTYLEDVYNLTAALPIFTMSAWNRGVVTDAASGYRMLDTAIAYVRTLDAEPFNLGQMFIAMGQVMRSASALDGESVYVPGAIPTQMVAACGVLDRPDGIHRTQRQLLAHHHPRKVARLAVLLADCRNVFLKDHLFAPVIDPNGLIWPALSDELRAEVQAAMHRNGIKPVTRYVP